MNGQTPDASEHDEGVEERRKQKQMWTSLHFWAETNRLAWNDDAEQKTMRNCRNNVTYVLSITM